MSICYSAFLSSDCFECFQNAFLFVSFSFHRYIFYMSIISISCLSAIIYVKTWWKCKHVACLSEWNWCPTFFNVKETISLAEWGRLVSAAAENIRITSIAGIAAVTCHWSIYRQVYIIPKIQNIFQIYMHFQVCFISNCPELNYIFIVITV